MGGIVTGVFATLDALKVSIASALDVLLPPPMGCRLCGQSVSPSADIPVCASCIGRMPPAGERLCTRCGRPWLSSKGPTRPWRSGEENPALCRTCDANRSAVDFARCYGIYDGYLRDCIHALKYRWDLGAAHVLGALMSWVVAGDGRFAGVDVIVPVPLHPKREQDRGYNQAAELARVIGGYLGRPVVSAAWRTRETTPQSTLQLNERFNNVRGAFQVTHPQLVAGRRLLIVDDIWTTGATMHALAFSLKRAGASVCMGISAASAVVERDL